MSRGGAPMPLRAVAAVARRTAAAIAVEPPAEPKVYFCSACGLDPVGPRPDVCRGCARKESEIELAAARADRLLVPPRFRWADLSVKPFTWIAGGASIVHPAALAAVEAFRGSLLVLRGPSGCGKTALATAKLMQAAAETSAVFVPCEDVAPDAPDQTRASQLMIRASQDGAALLDDVGADLSGAPAGGGLSSYRGERVRRIIRAAYNRSGAGTRRRLLIVTLDLPDREIDLAYGHDVTRRLIEKTPDTLVIWLGPAPQPEPARGSR